jgi:hypothetical protein
MEEGAVFAPVQQEEIRADIGALFRGAVRMTLECLLEQEVREMVGHGGTSDSAAARITSTEPTFEGC